MHIFWSKKTKLNDYEKAMSKFNADMKSTKTIEQYDSINKIYNDIRTYYENKSIKEEFDIKIEKIRIERNLGIHHNDIISFSMAYYIAIIGSIFYFLFQLIINSFDKYSNEVKIGISLLFLFAMGYSASHTVGKEIMKDKPRNLMLNISLKVLEDIEKEVGEKKVNDKEKQDKIDRHKWLEKAQQEIAVTKQSSKFSNKKNRR